MRQTVDHWNNGGVDLTQEPEYKAILATLYPQGTTGQRGVHNSPAPDYTSNRILENMRHINSGHMCQLLHLSSPC